MKIKNKKKLWLTKELLSMRASQLKKQMEDVKLKKKSFLF